MLKSSGEEDGASRPGTVPTALALCWSLLTRQVPKHSGGSLSLSSTPRPHLLPLFLCMACMASLPLVYLFTEMSLEANSSLPLTSDLLYVYPGKTSLMD